MDLQSAVVNDANATIEARALYVAERLDLRSFMKSSRSPAQQPAVIPLDQHGTAMLYRYGAVVFFNAGVETQERFLRELRPHMERAYETPETEKILVRVNGEVKDGAEGGDIIVRDASSERLQVVAAVLAKSVALAQYEADVAATFDSVEPFAARLEKTGRGDRSAKKLLQYIGRSLLNEHKMVARVEVTDRPELIWYHPEFNEMYQRLADEFDLSERAEILDRKLELISRTVETVLDLLQKNRGLRVEWYIVILIVLEIVLSLYDIFVK